MSEPTTEAGTSQELIPDSIERFFNGRGWRIVRALLACFFVMEGARLLAEAKWLQSVWHLTVASALALRALKPRPESRWWSVAIIIVMIALPVLFVVMVVRWWALFGS